MLDFIANLRLFGLVYAGLQPNYFDQMTHDSGVFICPMVQMSLLKPAVRFPGDIDILIVPYENDFLQLDRVLAIEVKVVRASFEKQGRSPNDFGVSQTAALLRAGFPYCAVAHLIVSDESPHWAWRQTGVARIIDENGTAELLPPEDRDLLPRDLIERSFGRLRHLHHGETFGVAAAYINDFADENRRNMLWHPTFMPAEANKLVDFDRLETIGRFVNENANNFLDNPRFDRL